MKSSETEFESAMMSEQAKSAQEILTQYSQGKRHFIDLDIPDGEDFSGVNLENVIFEKCWLSIANFSNARLKNAVFRDCNIKCSSFHKADLRNSNFYGSAVEAIVLEDANLEGANFEGAWLYGCELRKGETPFS